ncbi:hypothetical protein [Ruania alba]|uniref:Tail assembly chaperone n=1 Tax=Ruania alba TaxID=648782 RepID=A0A1H5KNP8_9MICO|nr:hypothetical protein [Ruania alba]SEE66310.1 hypothetical protein SAMN04488554_2361 [Ruania alba]
MRTSYEFTLPRGYVDDHGTVHRGGTMRLATARDELEPLRDPTITGSDDPRLTVLVLARVVEQLGSLELVTPHEVEGLFAADLAFLQDFYGVINFGTEAEFDEFVAAHAVTERSVPPSEPTGVAEPAADGPELQSRIDAEGAGRHRPRRSAIEEIPGETG